MHAHLRKLMSLVLNVKQIFFVWTPQSVLLCRLDRSDWTYRMQMSTFKIPLDTFGSKWPRVVKSVTQNQEVMRACYRWIFLEQFLQHWQNIMRYGRIFASGYQYSITENCWVAKDWLWFVGFTINFKYIYLYQFGWNIEWSQFEFQKLFAVWKGAIVSRYDWRWRQG